ncbi:peptidoglycan DD-metalloendopeptidase family protein [Oryzobacter telluris]|uniref:peptidoglycan DD-metalloendopeptidase family protein n=1 Tax=Oryzobacter telluris TaxID=3149179 RepID=UPI00370DBD06
MGRPDRAPLRASRRAIALGTSLLCAAALATTSAQAVSTGSDPGKEKRKVDAQVDQLKDKLDDTSSDLADAYAALQRTKKQLPGVQAALAKAQSTAAAADRANAVAAQELEAAVASEKKAQAQLTKTTTEVTESRTRVAQFAAQIYQEQGFGQLDMALTSSDPQQFADRIALVDTVMDVQSEAMERLASERASLTALEDHLSALRADSAAKKKQAEAALAKAKKARDAAAAAKAQMDALAARQAAQARTVADKLARDKARLSQMQSEQARLKKILVKRAAQARARAEAARKKAAAERKRRNQSSHSRPSTGGSGGGSSSGSGKGYLSRPSNGRVSSEFGMRFHPIYHYWKLHSGRDYAAPCGSPVRAAASGDIISAGDGGGYGNRVVIDHGLVSGESLATTYNHLQSIRQWGGHVSRGEVIGYEGSTGTSTGCHLHFETLENGDFVDPRKWL